MTTFPGSPKLLKGGLVLIDADTGAGAAHHLAAVQPGLAVRARCRSRPPATEAGQRSEALRFKGRRSRRSSSTPRSTPPTSSNFPTQNRATVEFGIQPQLAALESMINPTSAAAARGQHRWRAPARWRSRRCEAPLTLFVWSKSRIVPVRVTDFSITEEAFDPALNPIRAKVSLGLRVLSVDDLGFSHKGGSLFLSYLQRKEQLAAKAPARQLRAPRHRRHSMMRPAPGLPAGATPCARRSSRRPAATTASPTAQLDAAPTARRSPICGAASCRSRSSFALLQRARRRAATASTISRRSISAIPSSSGACATPTARCGPTELTETVGRRCASRCPKAFRDASDDWLRASSSRC